jgi:hypothetical protein
MANLSVDLKLMAKAIDQRKHEISDEEIGNYLRGAIIAFYNKALPEVPQWSGHMAANLTIEIDGKEGPAADIRGPNYNYMAVVWSGEEPEIKEAEAPGNKASVIANQRNSWVDTAKLTPYSTATVYYKNEPSDSYYDDVEGYTTDLRKENTPSRALFYAGLYMGATVRYTKAYRAKLKTMKIGG